MLVSMSLSVKKSDEHSLNSHIESIQNACMCLGARSLRDIEIAQDSKLIPHLDLIHVHWHMDTSLTGWTAENFSQYLMVKIITFLDVSISIQQFSIKENTQLIAA